MTDTNLDTIELRWKQATESHQAAMRYPAHAIQDISFLLNQIKEMQQKIDDYKKLVSEYEELIDWLRKG